MAKNVLDNCIAVSPTIRINIPIMSLNFTRLIPGLVLASILATLANFMGRDISIVSPLILAMGIGIIFRYTVTTPVVCKEGIATARKQIIRIAIILLGTRVTLNNIMALGSGGLFLATIPLTLTIVLTVLLGKAMKISPSLSLLLAMGTGICGASAIVTTSTVTKARDEEIIVAIGSISALGTVLMLLYPYLYQAGYLGLTAIQYAHLAGASIHEVAQVAAAGSISSSILSDALMIKLARVAMLMPVMTVLSLLMPKGASENE